MKKQHGLWLWIATLALVAALALMLFPQAGSTHSGGWLAILPIFFAGLISPLVLFVSVTHLYTRIVPASPLLRAAFQRPPPSRRG